MKTKTLTNLSLLLFILIIAFFGQKYYAKFQSEKPNEYLKTVNNFDKNNINKINISKGSESLELTEQDDQWMVNNKKANNATVVEFINSFFPETSPQILATSDQQLENLKVTSDLASKVIFQTSDDSNLTLLVGKKSGTTTAIALDQDKTAYSLRAISQPDFDLNSWVDLTLIQATKENVKSITFDDKITSFTLENNGENWTLTDSSEAVSSDAVNTFLLTFDPLRAEALATQEEIDSYHDVADYSLEILLSNNETKKLDLYKNEQEYLVKLNDQDYFIITDTKGDNLQKTRDSFLIQE